MNVGRFAVVMLVIVLGVVTAVGQFKPRTDARPSSGSSLVQNDGSNWLLGWFDANRFQMRQSYALSYSSMGGKGISLGEYTNSMFYQISDPLSVQFDLSFTHVPFSSFGNKLSNDLSGIRVSRAQLDYRPSENTLFQIQFRQIPAGSYLRGFPSFGSDFGLDRPSEYLR